MINFNRIILAAPTRIQWKGQVQKPWTRFRGYGENPAGGWQSRNQGKSKHPSAMCCVMKESWAIWKCLQCTTYEKVLSQRWFTFSGLSKWEDGFTKMRNCRRRISQEKMKLWVWYWRITKTFFCIRLDKFLLVLGSHTWSVTTTRPCQFCTKAKTHK